MYLLCCWLLSTCNSATFVDRITLVNPTDFSISIDVNGPDDPSWLPLGIAQRNAETVREQVIDMGETWIFRFSYAGEEVAQDTIARKKLQEQQWRYTVPPRVGEILLEKGYKPSLQ